jgi:hypothetical protein
MKGTTEGKIHPQRVLNSSGMFLNVHEIVMMMIIGIRSNAVTVICVPLGRETRLGR